MTTQPFAGYGPNALAGLTAANPLGALTGGQDLQTAAAMQQVYAAAGALMSLLVGGASPSMSAGMPSFGGMDPGMANPGLSTFLGTGSGGGGPMARPASAGRGHHISKAKHGSSHSSGKSSSKAVDVAKKYLGRRSGSINNMKNFSHAGGVTNNCADFVSACLANAGVYKKKSGDASVATLKQHLLQQGWKKVSKAHTKPGDVAIFNGSQHVELVSKAGAKQLIGSNNNGQSYQTVTTNTPNWGSVEYYTKG